MSEEVAELFKKLGMDKDGKKPKAEHHLQGRIFPFHTREPERVKFNTDFNEIVGIVTRCSLGKELILEDLRDKHFEKILERLDISENITEIEIKELFSVDFNNMKAPIMFQYFPVELETTKDRNESRGKALLGYYLTKLLRLDENVDWKKFIERKDVNDLYEEVYIECLPEIEALKERKDNFHFFNQDEIVSKFNQDLSQLIKNEKFFIENIGLLISYYFFYYIMQETQRLMSTSSKKTELWFTYDKEKVTSGRDAVKKGYKRFNDMSRELLINNDMLDYLNILSNTNKYQSFEEIINNTENHHVLGYNLMLFNEEFASQLESSYEPIPELSFQIKQLKKTLELNISKETLTRYRKSFDEFSNLGFIKNRGRLGYILNATKEFVILLTAVVIGDEEKILLNQLFLEFENRGVYFDKHSKKEIVYFFENINILEKLSDSGDAQYVKSIL